MLMEAIVHAFAKLGVGVTREPRLSQFGSLAFAKAEPDGVDLTRAGRRFYLGDSGSITGSDPVQAVPTTAAQWVIFNPPNLRKTLFFEEIGMFVTAGTPGAGGILLGCLFSLPLVVAPGTLATGFSIQNMNPASTQVSQASIKSAITISNPAAPVWFPLAENPSPNVGAFPGAGGASRRDLAGKIAVPPGYGLGLAALALAGTNPKYAPFAQWVELETENE